jgi:Fe-S-cluster containining protein
MGSRKRRRDTAALREAARRKKKLVDKDIVARVAESLVRFDLRVVPSRRDARARCVMLRGGGGRCHQTAGAGTTESSVSRVPGT